MHVDLNEVSTGDDGHLYGITVHANDDNLSIKLWSLFGISKSFQSNEITKIIRPIIKIIYYLYIHI